MSACNSPRCARSTGFWLNERNCGAIRCANCNCRRSTRNFRSFSRAHQIDELLAAPLKIDKNRAAPVWMPLRDVAIMELFYSSGLRLSELAALDVADVDLYTESVRVFGKGRKERECPVGLARAGNDLSVIGRRPTCMRGRFS